MDEDGQKIVSNVDWASGQAKTAVLGVLTAESVPGINSESTRRRSPTTFYDHVFHGREEG